MLKPPFVIARSAATSQSSSFKETSLDCFARVPRTRKDDPLAASANLLAMTVCVRKEK